MGANLTWAILVILRIYGLVSAIGAVFILRNAEAARKAGGDADALRWVTVGGILTFVAGIFLAGASRWAVVPAALLALQQTAFYWRQVRALPPGAPRPQPVHATIASLVAIAAAILASKGALR